MRRNTVSSNNGAAIIEVKLSNGGILNCIEQQDGSWYVSGISPDAEVIEMDDLRGEHYIVFEKGTFDEPLRRATRESNGHRPLRQTKLRKLCIPSNVRIKGSTFKRAAYLEEVVIESGANLDCSAFEECEALKTVTFVGVIDSQSGNKVKFVDLPESAFKGCSSLTKVDSVVADGISNVAYTSNSISNYAFMNCESLCEVNLPPIRTMIPTGVFRGCKSLHDITIPIIRDVDRLGYGRWNQDEPGFLVVDDAFGGCPDDIVIRVKPLGGIVSVASVGPNYMAVEVIPVDFSQNNIEEFLLHDYHVAPTDQTIVQTLGYSNETGIITEANKHDIG